MSDYEVKVLKPGYADWIGPSQQRAEGTSTLVKGRRLVVVDTGGPWSKQELLSALTREGVSPEDIGFVVCTHGHLDHTGNNNLFPNATFIWAYDIGKDGVYTFHKFSSGQPYKIDDDVEVISTPGHTSQDISVIVRTSNGTVAIVGDLFERAEDREDEDLWRSFSDLPEEQQRSRENIMGIVDFIVPGHGDMFPLGRA